MDVARLNFSHGSHKWHGERIHRIRELDAEPGRSIASRQDLRGPNLRIGELPRAGVDLRQGQMCPLSTQPYDAIAEETCAVKSGLLSWRKSCNRPMTTSSRCATMADSHHRRLRTWTELVVCRFDG
jgi:hypothetical protein